MTAVCMMFNATKIVAIESRGFLFASPISRGIWNFNLTLARKPCKLPQPNLFIKEIIV